MRRYLVPLSAILALAGPDMLAASQGDAMKITLEMSGGVTGLRTTRTVDVDALPAEQKAEAARLVAAAKAEAADGGKDAAGSAPVLKITIDGGATLRQSAGQSPAFSALFDWVNRHAQPR
jgi:hypothetical protein